MNERRDRRQLRELAGPLATATRACAVAGLGLLGLLPAHGMETDPYLALDTPLHDSASRVNAHVNDVVRARLAGLNGRRNAARLTCDEAVHHALRGFRQPLYRRVGVWANKAPGIDRYPKRATGTRAYYRQSILGEPYYANLGVPLGRTVNIGGIYLSVDKLGHFFSFGVRYNRQFQRAVRSGQLPEDAARNAVLWGLNRERTIEGTMTTGILSHADLEANYQGFRLVRSLCSEDAPARIRHDDQAGWVLDGEIDLRDFINPDWDEAFNTSFYVKRRWKNIRERVRAHCGKLESELVQQRFRRYAETYRPSYNALLMRELEAAGKLPTREQFSLRAVCAAPPGP